MPQRESDRRVRRTRAQLRQALAELLLEKDLQSVTVRELTDRADVNRGTFYAHYKDIFDMAQQVEDELLDEITAALDACPPDQLRQDAVPILREVFRFAYRNQGLCRGFFGHNVESRFFQRLNSLIYDKCIQEWSGLYPLGDLSGPNYCLEFVVAGTVGLIRAWALRGFLQSPEEMAQLANGLILSGLRSL